MSRIDSIDKTFDPAVHESKLYQTWLANGYFQPAEDEDRPPYTIVIPPPLHFGCLVRITRP